MILDELVERLGYADSGSYLRDDSGAFDRVVDYGHLFRQARRDPCCLKGVYTLKQSDTTAIPVVYVCDVASETQAKDVHRLVWNQDTVPFVIVNSPKAVRVYPGFSRQPEGRTSSAVTKVEREFHRADLVRIAGTLSAAAIDTGETWQTWGPHIRSDHRVDWQLLDNLRMLDMWLQQSGDLDRTVSHTLIGKYVYLRYLRDREILSSRKLDKWGIDADCVFGRKATCDGLQALSERLDEWLNGEVFPIDFRRRSGLRDEHIARVAGTFLGDEPLGTDQWQLHLDFKAYDFSYIPIEVLSIVYQQFLHTPGKDGNLSRGRSAGAYYTPIPVVNLMLSELEEHRPLERGMRVFDPSCGSGAFLVQAFRRLIEKEFPPSGEQPRVQDLRELVETHFFGVDTDEDACRVAKLSLILTLLDYIHPPDLEANGRPGPKPRLPHLRDNIFCGNFFDDDAKWRRVFASRKADWVVGNPPWKQLESRNIRNEDVPVLAWMKAESKHRPVGNYQMARAFAWRAAEYVDEGGELALFLPAMTLFEEAAQSFRSQFSRDMRVHTIINFSNLRHVISGGRFTHPAASFFYCPRLPEGEPPDENEVTRTYAPLIANQEATRPSVDRRRNESWSIIVNASEIRDIPVANVSGGQGHLWKVGLWGSDLDVRFLRSLQRRFLTIGDMHEKQLLVVREGPQLRDGDATSPPKGVELVEELIGKQVLNVKPLKRMRDFFAFPPDALETNKKTLLRLRGGKAGLAVCKGPHVIVDAARRFAVYSGDFIVVPPRQIGVTSPTVDREILKALSLFLSSDFAFYYEFLTSSELGIGRDRSTLKALRTMPTSLMEMSRRDLKNWAAFHDELATATKRAYQDGRLWEDAECASVAKITSVIEDDLVSELNSLVNESLGLSQKERALVHDLVRVKLALNDGRLGQEAIGKPNQAEMRSYGSYLRRELDDYIRGEFSGKHDVQIVHDGQSGMVRIGLARATHRKGQVPVLRAGTSQAAALEECRRQIRQERAQWVYFDRNLRAYDGDSTYILKPMQRFQWTRTQARLDARDIISESIIRRGKT